MKINQTIFTPQIPIKQKIKEAEQVNIEETPKDAQQILKETIQRKLSEAEEARMNTGENDPKSQNLISKFKSGKKLTPKEMNYLQNNAPAMVGYIDRIQKEREVIEFGMKMAPTKADVQMVTYRAAKQIEKYQDPAEREIRARHLADAKHEYEQTEEYKEKPNSPLDKQEKQTYFKVKSQKPSYNITIEAYKKYKPSTDHS